MNNNTNNNGTTSSLSSLSLLSSSSQYDINVNGLTCFLFNYKELDVMNKGDKKGFKKRTVLNQTNIKIKLDKFSEIFESNDFLSNFLFKYVFTLEKFKLNFEIGILDLMLFINTFYNELVNDKKCDENKRERSAVAQRRKQNIYMPTMKPRQKDKNARDYFLDITNSHIEIVIITLLI